jgi:hypothetical protein
MQAELGRVEEDLPEEFRQVLQIEQVKLDNVLADQVEKLSKASPEELKEVLRQIILEKRKNYRNYQKQQCR